MDHAKIEKIIDNISFGNVLVNTEDKIDFILCQPDIHCLAMSHIVYDNEYSNSIKNGLMTDDEILEHCKLTGKWSDALEQEISGIQEDIRRIKFKLIDLIFNTENLKKSKLLLRSAERALIERLSKKFDLLRGSAENYALMQKQRYIISRITNDINFNIIWKSYDEFQNSQDLSLINNLCDIFFEESRISIKDIREIARSYQWRYIWSASKEIGQLFNRIPTEWTDNQKNLVYWSKVYDMVFDAYERPSLEIINDDDLLDSWLLQQNEKIEGKHKKGLGDKLANKSGNGRQEVFVMSDKEGSKKVYDINDGFNRALIKKKQELISSSGHIKDQDAPDSKIEIMQQALTMKGNKIKDIRRRT